jgi:hypothetical protein
VTRVALNVEERLLAQVRAQPLQRGHEPEILEVRRVETVEDLPDRLGRRVS